MDLEDLIDPEYGLQQDEWSLLNFKFGKDLQLKVVGWSGRVSSGTKLYIVKCAACSADIDLHGDGHFKGLKGDILKGKVPCGCSKSPRWSNEQFTTMCKRKASEEGV